MAKQLPELQEDYGKLCAMLGERHLMIATLQRETTRLLGDLSNVRKQIEKLMQFEPASEIKLPELPEETASEHTDAK